MCTRDVQLFDATNTNNNAISYWIDNDLSIHSLCATSQQALAGFRNLKNQVSAGGVRSKSLHKFIDVPLLELLISDNLLQLRGV